MKQIILLLLLCCSPALGQTYHVLFTAPPSKINDTYPPCGHGGSPYCLPITQLSYYSGSTIASFGALPPGNYVITATPVFYTTDSNPATIGCAIGVPVGHAQSQGQIAWATIQSSGPTTYGGVVFGYGSPLTTGLVRLAATQAVTLVCSTQQSVGVESVLMVATKVATLTP